MNKRQACLGLKVVLVLGTTEIQAGWSDTWNSIKESIPSAGELWQSTKDKASSLADKTINVPVNYVKKEVFKQLEQRLIPDFNASNPYKHTMARVRVGSGLPSAEREIAEYRMSRIQPALEQFLGAQIPAGQTLRIGFCGSGGGYRAMLSTTGFLAGAGKIGLLDTALYMSALSGSTWALAPWTSLQLPITTFREQLIAKTQRTMGVAGKELLPLPSSGQMVKVFNNLERKFLFDQPITSVDLWGAMIANSVFSGHRKPQNIYLSEQGPMLDTGTQVIPIYTAVHPLGELEYYWFEFTPFEIGSTDLQAFVPTWAFGRKFDNGVSVNTQTNAGPQYAPEQTLGFYMGIFGSAFTVNVAEMIDMLRKAEDPSAEDYSVKLKIVEEITESLNIKDVRLARISPAEVFNYTYQLAGSPISNRKKIVLVDAGLAFNLPTPPLLRPERAIDVIFIFDSSADIGSAGELRKAEQYAQVNNLPFPPIDYQQAKTQSISIFANPQNPKCPTIIYLPLIKDPELPGVKGDPLLENFDPKRCVEQDYCSTFNFKYNVAEFETLTKLTEVNIVGNAEKIKTALQNHLMVKYGITPPAANPESIDNVETINTLPDELIAPQEPIEEPTLITDEETPVAETPILDLEKIAESQIELATLDAIQQPESPLDSQTENNEKIENTPAQTNALDNIQTPIEPPTIETVDQKSIDSKLNENPASQPAESLPENIAPSEPDASDKNDNTNVVAAEPIVQAATNSTSVNENDPNLGSANDLDLPPRQSTVNSTST